MRIIVKVIFQKFICVGSYDVLEISDLIKGKIVQYVNDYFVDCEFFEEVLLEIMVDLKNNYFLRFMNLILYKECVQSGVESFRDICDRFI